ncbi:GntR family transcriptional regulator [Psychrobacillus soli]|uniref:GntR family transcriptional regulator n=1 Tax=Psychrobacillus soli TaxID=1543965 RepID=A0A544TLD4_9BACI|nr:GntR family transcriptional regulator [Psychrobacillus soli]TQR18228.1 GntR family transcriptional regulator [Psychrobacillus soli]
MTNEISATEVTKVMRNAILDGTLKQGERIIQAEWAERMGVSRIPIRESLSKLEMEGLVVIVPHKGAIVSTITQDDIEELYYIRSFLESTVVLKALPYIGENEKAKIQHVFNDMVEAVNEQEHAKYNELHDQFHRLLREKSPWKRSVKMVENLASASMAPDLLIKNRLSIQDEHRRIVEAIMINDPEELQAAIEYHIHRTKNNLLYYLNNRKQSGR